MTMSQRNQADGCREQTDGCRERGHGCAWQADGCRWPGCRADDIVVTWLGVLLCETHWLAVCELQEDHGKSNDEILDVLGVERPAVVGLVCHGVGPYEECT